MFGQFDPQTLDVGLHLTVFGLMPVTISGRLTFVKVETRCSLSNTNGIAYSGLSEVSYIVY